MESSTEVSSEVTYFFICLTCLTRSTCPTCFLVELPTEESSEVIDRACGFLQEHNNNYKVSWEEANEKIALGPEQVGNVLRLT